MCEHVLTFVLARMSAILVLPVMSVLPYVMPQTYYYLISLSLITIKDEHLAQEQTLRNRLSIVWNKHIAKAFSLRKKKTHMFTMLFLLGFIIDFYIPFKLSFHRRF